MKIRRGVRAGYTLLELAFVMAVSAVLLAAVAPIFQQQLELALARRVSREVTVISDAARWFYADQKRWPTGVPELAAAGYLDRSWNGKTPWGDVYGTIATANGFTVAVGVPVGLEGLVTSGVVAPAVAITDERAIVSTLVPVPGREVDESKYVHRSGGDTMTGDLFLDGADLLIQKDGVTNLRMGVDADKNFAITSSDGVERLSIDRTGKVSLNGQIHVMGNVTADDLSTNGIPGVTWSGCDAAGNYASFHKGLFVGSVPGGCGPTDCASWAATYGTIGPGCVVDCSEWCVILGVAPASCVSAGGGDDGGGGGSGGGSGGGGAGGGGGGAD